MTTLDIHGNPFASFGLPELPFMTALSESISADDPFRIIWLRSPPVTGRIWGPAIGSSGLQKACARALVYLDMATAADVLFHEGLRCYLLVVTFPFVLPIRGAR